MHSAVVPHCTYHNEHGQKKKEQRKALGCQTEDHRQARKTSRGYKSISRDLDVSCVHHAQCRQEVEGLVTFAKLSGRGRQRKVGQRLQRKIVPVLERGARTAAKQYQADLQTQLFQVVLNAMAGQITFTHNVSLTE